MLSRESENYKKAREKDDLITPKVKSALNDAGFNVVDDFLQGSMIINTGIIPLDGDYDIDRAIVIDTDSEDPVEAKKVIRDTLLAHGFTQPKIKKPCVTADYQADNIHLFICAQASFCAALGSLYQPNMLKDIYVYNYNSNTREYEWYIHLSDSRYDLAYCKS